MGEGLSSPSHEERSGDASGVWNEVELELDVVVGVKMNKVSFLGGVGVAGMTFGVPGCFDGVLPLGLGLGLPFEPWYFPPAPGDFPLRDERHGDGVRDMLASSSGEKRSMPSLSTMVSGEARASSKSRSVRELLRCGSWLSGNPSLLFVFDATTGLNADGKEDGGGTGERGWWPLNNDARATAATKPSKEPIQKGQVLPWAGATAME